MKNKLGIILVLGIVAVFDTTNAMDKEDPFAHLDPLKTEQEVRDILKEKQRSCKLDIKQNKISWSSSKINKKY